MKTGQFEKRICSTLKVFTWKTCTAHKLPSVVDFDEKYHKSFNAGQPD